MPSGRENDKLIFEKDYFKDMLKEYGFSHVVKEEQGKTMHYLYQESMYSEDVQDLFDYLISEFDLK